MFGFTEDQNMIKELAASLSKGEIREFAHDVDEEARYPEEGMNVVAEAGLLGTILPEECGGAGQDALAMALVIEEIAKSCGATAAILTDCYAVQAGIMAGDTKGAPVLKELAGGKTASLAIYEKDLDSTVKDIEMTAVKTGEGYSLTGKKTGVVNIENSDYFLVAANVGDQGLALFVVPAEADGLKVERIYSRMGQRGCAAGELVFDACFVSADAMVGEAGKADDIIAQIDDYVRIGYAAQAVGLAQGAMDTAIQYVNERKQFGRSIASFQNTQQMMALHQSRVEAARLLLYDAADDKAKGRECAAKTAMAKVVASEVAGDASRKCSQFMGGFGYSREYSTERNIRDSKMIEVFGRGIGTQKTLIAAAIGVK